MDRQQGGGKEPGAGTGRGAICALFFYVLLLGPPSVIFEVRIKALNAAINQLPTAVAFVGVVATELCQSDLLQRLGHK